MARRRTIIGIGEALLAEKPGEAQPAGLALEVALHASRLGHTGMPISRIGQDSVANELLTMLKAREIDINHLQSDPDLPTGRLVVRPLVGGPALVEGRAAFDNLQWDFDLVDLAQSADAVIFGMLAQREAQASSVIRRFLSNCAAAVRVCDLSNRPVPDLPRQAAINSLELAEVAVIDAGARQWLRLGSDDDGPLPESQGQQFMRQADLALLIEVAPDRPPIVQSAEARHEGEAPIDSQAQAAAVVALTHAVLAGHDLSEALRIAERLAAHLHSKPDEPLPESLR